MTKEQFEKYCDILEQASEDVYKNISSEERQIVLSQNMKFMESAVAYLFANMHDDNKKAIFALLNLIFLYGYSQNDMSY